MSINNKLPEDILQKPYFWLLLIATALFTIYFGILWRLDDVAHIGMSALFLAGVGSLIWDRKETLKFQTKPLAIVIAVILILITLSGLTLDIVVNTIEVIVRVSPLMFGISLALLAAGFKWFKEYWRELTILFGLSMPSVILSPWDLSPLTAKVASVFLWAMGYNIAVDGIRLHLPQTSVIVARQCSGAEAMTYVFGISILFLVMFPIKRIHNFIVPIIAAAIGYIVNLIRVLAMCLLLNYGQKEAFDYWHEGDGALLIGVIAVLIFSVFYFTLLKFTVEDEEEDSEEIELAS
ncbi:MAG: cyanoexosortase A [Gloeocapsa sp. DLM2.Bin57]|nr:MAG: cyanoexosortase A [Gloeocapsa sp. DLM2.Bin57]